MHPSELNLAMYAQSMHHSIALANGISLSLSLCLPVLMVFTCLMLANEEAARIIQSVSWLAMNMQ